MLRLVTALAIVGAVVPMTLAGAAAPAGAATSVVKDHFARSIPDGWGSPDIGSPYELSGVGNGNAAWTDGNDGLARVSQPARSVETALPGVSLLDTQLLVSVATDKPATGWGQVTYVSGRQTDDLFEYRVRARRASNGAVVLAATKTLGTHSEIALGGEVVVPGVTHQPDLALNLRVVFTGTEPTTIWARAWTSGMAEPSGWQLERTDAEPALQAAGGVALRSYISGSTTNAPVTFATKYLDVTDIGTSSPPPPPPPPAPVSYGAAPLGSTNYPVPAGAVIVAPWGFDSSPGTWSAPVLTIAEALDRVPRNGTIVLRQGRYHEQVHILDKPVTLQNAPGEQVWLEGSSVVEGWTADGDAWRHDGWTTRLPKLSYGHAMVSSPGVLEAAHPDQVFVDGRQLTQVLSRSAVGPGTFFLDESTSRLYLGTNPTGAEVRVSDLQYAIDVNLSPGTVIRGIGVRRYGTPISRIAAVFVQSADVTVEDVVIEDNAAAGLSMNRVDSTVRRVTSIDNGQLGIHARFADGLVVDQVRVEGNNHAGFSPRQSAGGIKIHATRGYRVEDSLVAGNQGPGFWFDESTLDATVVRNRAIGNLRSGFQFELSAQALFAGNVSADNGEWGIYLLESSQIDVWNNTLIRNERAIQIFEGVREQTDPNDDGHDPRYGTNNPLIPWDVDDITIRNNVYSDIAADTVTMFGVDDSRKQESGWDMGISTDHNAFWTGSGGGPSWLANWSNWPVKMLVGSNLGEWQSRTGQDANSLVTAGGASSPYVADEAAGDYRVPAGSPAATGGAPIPAAVTAELGLPAGGPAPMGIPS